MVGALVVKSDEAGDTDLFAGTWAGGVFLSTNKGSSWTTVNNGLTDNNVVSLIVSDTNLFAGTTSGVFLSTDNGSSWSSVNNGLTFMMGPPDQADTASVISHLAVSTNGANGTNLFAATWGGGVFLSTDNGSNWSAINNGLPDNQITLSITSLTVSGANLFIGTSDGGMYVSTNNGASWTSADSGLTGSSVQVIAVIGTNVFAGTNNGIWRRPISEMVTGVEENQTQIPTLYALKQNYPNPFNPTTTISYQLPTNTIVTLKVYDVLGREIKTLVSERQKAGNHLVIFDANSLPSGVYFYRLQAGSYAETKKLVLLK
jgi:ligand-binding sensor domain-containing protein